jgi:hypothetical protein
MKSRYGALIWILAAFFFAACVAPGPSIVPPDGVERGEGAAKPERVVQPESAAKPQAVTEAEISEPKGTVTAAPGPLVEVPETPPPMIEDRDLFCKGIALLNHPDHPDPAGARTVFASLIEQYPQSQWRSLAETVVRLIDERDAFREVGRDDRLLREKSEADRSRMLQENEQLKKTVRELTEKTQTAVASLTQENEQLKQDLLRLKTLEIELEKRERMLR